MKNLSMEDNEFVRDSSHRSHLGSKIVHNDQFPPPHWMQCQGTGCSSTPLRDVCRRGRSTIGYMLRTGCGIDQSYHCNRGKLSVDHTAGKAAPLYLMKYFWKSVLPIAEK
jgi:hypothetical protein